MSITVSINGLFLSGYDTKNYRLLNSNQYLDLKQVFIVINAAECQYYFYFYT